MNPEGVFVQENIQTPNSPEGGLSPIRNEYNVQNGIVLKPFQNVTIQNSRGDIVEYTQLVESELAYYSATCDIEIGTDRCNFLQSYVDKMVNGDSELEGKVRVAIMNRGTEPNAFILPDGTICISQSLINLTDNLDELVGVLAHEIVHYKNKTFAIKAGHKGELTVGIGWVHELGSDSQAAKYMDKADLNSLALSDLFERMSRKENGNERDIVHQSGLTRSVESLALHSKIDTKNSHRRYKALHPTLKKEIVLQTNIEIVMDLLAKGEAKQVEKIISSLHQRDFKAVLGYCIDHFTIKMELNDSLLSELWKRMRDDSVDTTEAIVFLMTINQKVPSANSLSKIFDYDDLAGLVTKVYEMLVTGKYRELSDKYLGKEFGAYVITKITENTDINNFTGIYKNLNSIPRLTSFSKYFATAYNLTLKYINSNNPDSYANKSVNGIVSNHLIEALKIYLNDYHFYGENKFRLEASENEMVRIFESIKSAGIIKISKENYNKMITVLNNTSPYPAAEINKHKDAMVKAFEKVFGDNAYTEQMTPELFAKQIVNMSPFEIGKYFEKISIENKFTKEGKFVYIKEALRMIDGKQFTYANLNPILESLCGSYNLEMWRESNHHFENKWEKQTLEKVITHFKLHERVDDLLNRVNEKNKISKIKLKLEIIAECSGGPYDYDSLPERLFLGLVEDTFSSENPDLSILNLGELFQLISPILKRANALSEASPSKENAIYDFDRFSELVVIKELIKRKSLISFDSKEKILIENKRSLNYLSGNMAFRDLCIFGDEISSLLLFQNERDAFIKLLTEKDLADLNGEELLATESLIESVLPRSVNKDKLIKYFIIRALTSDMDIKDKIDVLKRRKRSIGPEEIQIVAEQIYDLDSYKLFKAALSEIYTDYLTGKRNANGIALIDFTSSEANQNPEDILTTSTNDPGRSTLITNDFAGKWLDLYLPNGINTRKGIGESFGLIKFDTTTKKVVTSGVLRDVFMSFKDSITSLKNLSASKKAAIVLKCLTDPNGLLTSNSKDSEESKKRKKQKLTDLVLEGLSFNNDFIQEVIKFGIKNTPAQLISLPVAQILSKFLFRGLDISKLDTRLLLDQIPFRANNAASTRTQAYYAKDMPYILESTTEDLMYFGLAYSSNQDSKVSKLAQESNRKYRTIVDKLVSQIEMGGLEEDSEQGSSLSPSVEAIIKALEFSAPYIRAMQIAVQMIDFPPEILDRLSRTQDSVKANGKGEFWMNLVERSASELELGNIVNAEGFRIDSYLGGGSLFTTYSAEITDKDGVKRQAVIKTLNPNAEAFVNKSYNAAISTFHSVETSSKDPKTIEYARIASSLIELSNKWCKMDINDTEYNERDDQFRESIEMFNSQNSQGIHIEAPRRIFNSKKVKIEERYDGITLNKLLNDKEVPPEKKSQYIKTLSKLFEHQFNFSSWKDSSGEKKYILHSDPHAGNYMVSFDKPDTLGVIDRSMYLVLKESEVRIFRSLLKGNGVTFVGQFMAKCLEINGVVGKEALKIIVRITGKLGKEFFKQKITRKTNPLSYLQVISKEFLDYGESFTYIGNVDGLNEEQTLVLETVKLYPYRNPKELFRIIKYNSKIDFASLKLTLQELEDKKVIHNRCIKIPVQYNLMIRNIVAMDKLKQRYGKSNLRFQLLLLLLNNIHH